MPGRPSIGPATTSVRRSTVPPGCWPPRPAARSSAPRSRPIAGDRRPPGVELVDLGEHRLADLTRPERVFQVAHAELGSKFPPLRPSTSTATTCRSPCASFETLDHLSRLIDKSLVVVAARHDRDVRYRLLETVRAYAAERLSDADEEAAVGRRHRDFFLDLADQWVGTVEADTQFVS